MKIEITRRTEKEIDRIIKGKKVVGIPLCASNASKGSRSFISSTK